VLLGAVGIAVAVVSRRSRVVSAEESPAFSTSNHHQYKPSPIEIAAK